VGREGGAWRAAGPSTPQATLSALLSSSSAAATPLSPSAAALEAVEAGAGGDDGGAMLRMVVAQRERARREASTSCAEAGSLREQLRASQVRTCLKMESTRTHSGKGMPLDIP